MSAPEREARATSADGLCRTAFAAAGAPTAGVALVAVGGYGRRDLAPHSDLDVVLVHQPDVDLGETATQLWYPLWDSGTKVDHSVRSLPEMVEAATDLKVALGLLDARHLAGDPGVTLELRSTMLADWRRQARTRLAELRVLVDRRHELLGELAHAAVPDLKDAEGGLRDANVLRALQMSWLVDASPSALATAHGGLLDVRDALHEVAGRATDRVGPEHWAPLAERLGLDGEETAQRHVRTLGRRVAHLSRLTWRRVAAVQARPAGERDRRKPALVPISEHLAISRGEVVLQASARPDRDPTLLLQAAAEAASRGLTLSPATAARLVRECPDLPAPWPEEARDALVRLLAAGRGLLPVWETLEETGAVERFLPEWERIRLLPHASEIHRFTVDRHVVETCVEAGALIREVARPDLLVVAALLHDIGKGGRQEHCAAGEPIAREVATRMGFGSVDVERIARLVRAHLVLASLATTRDPDDPATVAALLAEVPDAVTLELLRNLTEADSRATSPAAWTDWRAWLVDRLTTQALGVVGSVPSVPVGTPGWAPVTTGRSPSDVVVEVLPSPGGSRLMVMAGERAGLLSDIAGVLCGLGVGVREARAWLHDSDPQDWGCSTWEVDDPHLDPALVRDLLGREQPQSERCRCRRAATNGLAPVVRTWPDVSPSAAVLEVRMGDAPGAVHRMLGALAEEDLTVSSAHVSTLGPQAVDVFYVQEAGGVRPSEERAAAAAHAVRRAVGG